MSKRDYYQVLEVSRSASGDEIKRSYRRLALKYHPDRNAGDRAAETRFKEVSEAYEVISDPERRRVYDQFGHDGLKGRGFGFHDPSDIFREFSSAFGGSIFGDLFGFGFGSSREHGPVQGRDVDYRLELTLEEVAFGVRRKINFFRQGTCKNCGGSGEAPGSKSTTCPACSGSGRIRQTRQTLFGVAATEVPCAKCGGRGTIIQSPCRECRGQGVKEEEVNMTIDVPPGVEDGMILRQRGAGEIGLRGGPAGALNLHIKVKKHEIFRRSGADIFCVVPISMTLAALGGSIQVATLEGESELKIPPGTQAGEEFRFKGQGLPRFQGSGRGDELIQVIVETPVNLSSPQKELLSKFAQSLEKRNRPSKQGLFQRLRNWLGS